MKSGPRFPSQYGLRSAPPDSERLFRPRIQSLASIEPVGGESVFEA